MKRIKFDAYDGVSLFGGLVFFAPAALLVRTQAGVSEAQFFLLQALLSGVIALGEIPTGRLTDRIGYRNSIILSQGLVLAARGLLAAAFWLRSLPLFIVEAVVEGFAICFSSGADDAYLYALCGEENYLSRSSHAANFGTAGFIVSAVSYAALYRFFGLSGLFGFGGVSRLFGLGVSGLLGFGGSGLVVSVRLAFVIAGAGYQGKYHGQRQKECQYFFHFCFSLYFLCAGTL